LDLVNKLFRVSGCIVFIPDFFVISQICLGWTVELVPRRRWRMRGPSRAFVVMRRMLALFGIMLLLPVTA
jgi:hypothetical protein